MREQSNRTIWKRELDSMAMRLGVECPALVFVSPRKSLFPSHIPRTLNAWASRRKITVTTDLVDVEPSTRHYFLAHELGHIVRKHFYLMSGSGSTLLIAVALCIASRFYHLTMMMNTWLTVALVVAAAVAYLFHCTSLLEYQADNVLVSLLGRSEAVQGCTEAGRLSGTLDDVRRKRLIRMQEHSPRRY